MDYLPMLMTASISTRGIKGACFTDDERLNMYVETLNFYCCNDLFSKRYYRNVAIVFAENSGFDLEVFKSLIWNLNGIKIEYISVDPSIFDISRGKGYNELLLIGEAVKRSFYIKRSSGFFKVTGRYPVYNIGYFLGKATDMISAGGYSMYCDIKGHRLYDILRLGWEAHVADVRLFGVRTDFFSEKILCRNDELNDYTGGLFEKLVFDVVKNELKKPGGHKIVCRYNKEPRLGALEGSNVNAVSFSKNRDGAKGRLKRFGGNSVRLLFPWFWF